MEKGPPPPPPQGQNSQNRPFFSRFDEERLKIKWTLMDRIDQILLPPVWKTCFSTLGWIWHAKNDLVILQKFWELGWPPPPFGKNSQKIPFFLNESPPMESFFKQFKPTFCSGFVVKIIFKNLLVFSGNFIKNNVHWTQKQSRVRSEDGKRSQKRQLHANGH